MKIRSVFQMAKIVERVIRKDLGGVRNNIHVGGSRAGESSYIRSRYGDIRLTDHPNGYTGSIGMARSYNVSDARGNPVVSVRHIRDDIRAMVAGSHQKAAERSAQEAAAKSAKAATRDSRIAANIAKQAEEKAKTEFFKRNGLDDAAVNVKKAAWQASPERQKLKFGGGAASAAFLTSGAASKARADDSRNAVASTSRSPYASQNSVEVRYSSGPKAGTIEYRRKT